MKKPIHSIPQLGQLLRARRKELGINQHEAGRRVGLEQTTVSSVENGNPGTRLETVFRLLAALEMELSISERQNGQNDSPQDDEW